MRKHKYYHICQRYVSKQVRIQTRDGRTYVGVIEKVETSTVHLLVPWDGYCAVSGTDKADDPEFELVHYYYPPYSSYPYPPYPYPPYPYPPYPYPYPYPYRRRRFRRVILPLSLLTAIALL